MTELQREARQILLGFIRLQDGDITAGKGVYNRTLGTLAGSSSARIVGVIDTKRRYTLPELDEDTIRQCRTAFYELGRKVKLSNAPEADAVFYTPLLYNPAILLCEFTEEGMILTVITARTTTTAINAAHAFHAWERKMPEKLESSLIPREKKKKKAAKKQARKEKRRNKRRKRWKKLLRSAAGSGIVNHVREILSIPPEPEEENVIEKKGSDTPRHGK